MSGPAQALRVIEALLFAAREPMPESALAEHLPEGADIAALLMVGGPEFGYDPVDLRRQQASNGRIFLQLVQQPSLGESLARFLDHVRRPGPAVMPARVPVDPGLCLRSYALGKPKRIPLLIDPLGELGPLPQ